jgi:hypothetical protein
MVGIAWMSHRKDTTQDSSMPFRHTTSPRCIEECNHRLIKSARVSRVAKTTLVCRIFEEFPPLLLDFFLHFDYD